MQHLGVGGGKTERLEARFEAQVVKVIPDVVGSDGVVGRIGTAP